MAKKEIQSEEIVKVYELGFNLIPSIAEENVATEVATIKAVLEKNEAVFITEEFPKLKPLAYTMVKDTEGRRYKFDRAYFGWIKFETKPNLITEIKSELDKNDRILRLLLIETVRENTLVSQKAVFKPEQRPMAAEQKKEGEPVSQEELDKTIDNLVVQ